MEIWAHTMVKNEARWLWFSVTSVIDFVDKILLWDTGSTDGTLRIASDLKKKYPAKIILNRVSQKTADDFTYTRQAMLDSTKSDWFLMLDGDEIWWHSSIKKATDTIRKEGDKYESIVVPTINAVGDIFHYQDNTAGRYTFGTRVGHYNLRAVNRKIPGLKSLGPHGVWGWVDGMGHMIQDRDKKKICFLDAPYLHTTFLSRGLGDFADAEVIKRSKKRKFEIGAGFPSDFYYPESFFSEKPDYIESVWSPMTAKFKARAFFETPARKLKRKIWTGRAGY